MIALDSSALIAFLQGDDTPACLDHDVSLVSSDRDFRHFVKAAGLRLLP